LEILESRAGLILGQEDLSLRSNVAEELGRFAFSADFEHRDKLSGGLTVSP
jgi:hypothetical protein